MATTRILFIGGTGVISRAVVERCLDLGHEVTVLNRGSTTLRPVPDHVESLTADVRDADAVDAALGTHEFDVVADFLSFTPDHVGGWVDRFAGRTGQYLFISSASAYQTPPERLPVTESTPLRNPFWQYSRDKIACEDLLVEAYRDRGFPATIVRPSHTYDRTMLPTIGHWTDIARMRAGKPVIVHGDGTSLWTITHARDVAVGIAGILGHHAAVGEAFHAVSPAAVTLRGYAETMAAWFGQPLNARYLPWEEWKAAHTEREAQATWDHIAHSPNCSMAKAEQALGYRPRYTSFEAVIEAVRWLIDNGQIEAG